MQACSACWGGCLVEQARARFVSLGAQPERARSIRCLAARPLPNHPPINCHLHCPSLPAGLLCLQVYQNEEEVGEALGQVLEQGLVPRQELYIVSKVW